MDQVTRRTAYKLRFEELDGLVVRVRKPSFSGLRLLNRAVRTLGEQLRGERLDPTVRLEAWGQLFDAFAAALVDWDLTDRGIAVPATRAGVHDQDAEFLLRLAHAWYHRVVLRLERPAAEPAPTPAATAPEPGSSAEELALLAIPFEVGNSAALEDLDEREPVEAAT